MRSLLIVPGDSERELEQALASGADVLILDLENSVPFAQKKTARQIVAAFIRAHSSATQRLYVRINTFASGLSDDDLASIMPEHPHGIVLPRSESGLDVTRLSVKLRVAEAECGIDDYSTRIIPMITDTAKAVLDPNTYPSARRRLAGLAWNAAGLATNLGSIEPRGPDGRFIGPFAFARTKTVLAATEAVSPAIDTAYPAIHDDAGLHRECIEAAAQGFTAKLAIHPAQIPIIHTAFRRMK